MKELEVKWLKTTTSSAAQIYSSGLQYCLVNKAHEQCHPFVLCKDFLQDAVHGHLHGHTASIYGFSYDPKTMPKLDLDRVRLALVNSSDKKFTDKAAGVVDLLNQVEKKLKLKPTHGWKISNPPKAYAKTGSFYLSGSGQWLNAPPMVSMFTLLVRVGFSHTVGKDFMDTLKGVANGKIKQYQTSDQSQTSQALKGIERILDKGYRKFFFIDTAKNYPKGVGIGTMHNSTGIVSFAQGYTGSVCKYWNRKSIDNPKPKEEPKKPDLDGATTTVNG